MLEWRRTVSMTFWLDKNSQTPSDAMTINACDSLSVMVAISGSPITPISSATGQTHTEGSYARVNHKCKPKCLAVEHSSTKTDGYSSGLRLENMSTFISEAAGEGSARVRAVRMPEPRRVSAFLILCPPLLDFGVLHQGTRSPGYKIIPNQCGF